MTPNERDEAIQKEVQEINVGIKQMQYIIIAMEKVMVEQDKIIKRLLDTRLNVVSSN